MPHYLVERTFTFEAGLPLPGPYDSLKTHLDFTQNNEQAGVLWIHSYLTPDRHKAFCLYKGPDPAAVRRAAELNGLPVDRISEIHFQAPYEVRRSAETKLNRLPGPEDSGGNHGRAYR